MGTRDDAIAEIVKLIEEQERISDDEGFTTKELQKKLGWGESKVSNLIDALIEKNIISCTRVYRINRANIPTTVIGYKLIAKAQDNAAAES